MKKFLILFLVLLVFLTFALPTFADDFSKPVVQLNSRSVGELGFLVYVDGNLYPYMDSVTAYINNVPVSGFAQDMDGYYYFGSYEFLLGIDYYLTVCISSLGEPVSPFSDPVLLFGSGDNTPANGSFNGDSVGKVSQITGEVMSGVDVILPGVAKTAVTTVETVFWNANGSLTSLGTLCIIGIVLGVGFGLWLMLKKRASKLG